MAADSRWLGDPRDKANGGGGKNVFCFSPSPKEDGMKTVCTEIGPCKLGAGKENPVAGRTVEKALTAMVRGARAALTENRPQALLRTWGTETREPKHLQMHSESKTRQEALGGKKPSTGNNCLN